MWCWVRMNDFREPLCSLFVCVCVCDSVVSDSATPWTVTHQAPLSMEILQERILEWVSIPFSRDLPNLGIEPRSLELQVDSLPSEPSVQFSSVQSLSRV